MSSFYDYQLEAGAGPLLNPVPARGGGDGRWRAHHNPLEPFVPGRRAAYRQRVPQLEPRAIPDGLFDELFAAMSSVRDQAILAFYVSTGARPSELLGLLGAHVDYGERLVAVVRKGTRVTQWLPASPEAFVWLRLYQQGLPAGLVAADQPVWWTLRRPWRRLDYDAMRAVIRRAVVELNWEAARAHTAPPAATNTPRCLRCPMLQPDPHQAMRLVDIITNLIITNLHERIKEATQRGWLGEVEGLQVSLAGAPAETPTDAPDPIPNNPHPARPDPSQLPPPPLHQLGDSRTADPAAYLAYPETSGHDPPTRPLRHHSGAGH